MICCIILENVWEKMWNTLGKALGQMPCCFLAFISIYTVPTQYIIIVKVPNTMQSKPSYKTTCMAWFSSRT